MNVFADRMAARIKAKKFSKFSWPSKVYYNDPVGFIRDVLGVTLNRWQEKIARAVAYNQRVAVRSGRKIGKSILAAALALWFYCTREDAQVLITAPAAHQINGVIWREVRMLTEKAAHAIDGQLNLTAANGLVSGFRFIRGFSVSANEAAAGTSGVNIFYIIDEASGVATGIFGTIEGNMAGADTTKLFAISNPTQNEGWHFDVFLDSEGDADKRDVEQPYEDGVVHFTVSSEDVANEDDGRTKGLAKKKWVRYMLKKYGKDSAEYVVHVQGRHALHEEGRAFTLGLVYAARDRWLDLDETKKPLVVGFDPAGDSDKGDLSAMAGRRGFKILKIEHKRGADEDELLAMLELFLADLRAYPEEPVDLLFDVGGAVGAKLLPRLREKEKHWHFTLYPVRSSDNAIRYHAAVEKRSAELVWNFRVWLKAGGAIPDDEKLYEECRAWEFTRIRHDSEKVKVNKDEVRKKIGRSPDRFDACALATWDVVPLEHNRSAVQLPGQKQPRTWGARPATASKPRFDSFGDRARRV